MQRTLRGAGAIGARAGSACAQNLLVPAPDAGEGGCMTSTIHTVTFDAHDPFAQAQFWAAVLGVPMADDDVPGDPEALVRSAGADVLFVQVPETKVVKNRAHLDVMPDDRTRDEEVARLHDLGAVLVADRRRPDGTGWVTLADPEGNEFCVLRSAAERAETS
jgi:predicted enzyme related to lactoylglutathione lyase